MFSEYRLAQWIRYIYQSAVQDQSLILFAELWVPLRVLSPHLDHTISIVKIKYFLFSGSILDRERRA